MYAIVCSEFFFFIGYLCLSETTTERKSRKNIEETTIHRAKSEREGAGQKNGVYRWFFIKKKRRQFSRKTTPRSAATLLCEFAIYYHYCYYCCLRANPKIFFYTYTLVFQYTKRYNAALTLRTRDREETRVYKYTTLPPPKHASFFKGLTIKRDFLGIFLTFWKNFNFLFGRKKIFDASIAVHTHAETE